MQYSVYRRLKMWKREKATKRKKSRFKKIERVKRKGRNSLNSEKIINRVELEEQVVQKIMNIREEALGIDKTEINFCRDDRKKSGSQLIIKDRNSKRVRELPMIDVNLLNKDRREIRTVKAMFDTEAKISLIENEFVEELG